MTYDELYEHIVNYIAQPLDDKRKACLILGAFMEFNLDCLDEGVDPRTIDMTGFVNEKLNQIENEPNLNEKIAQAMQEAIKEYDT
jgi:hypothetical protein